MQTVEQLRRELERLEKKSKAAAEARSALPPGSSRARVTSANARWARAAAARDRVAGELAEAESYFSDLSSFAPEAADGLERDPDAAWDARADR